MEEKLERRILRRKEKDALIKKISDKEIKVTDTKGNPIKGVEVRIRDRKGKIIFRGKTDERGIAKLYDLLNGVL